MMFHLGKVLNALRRSLWSFRSIPSTPDNQWPVHPPQNRPGRYEIAFARGIVIQEPSLDEIRAELTALVPNLAQWATLSHSFLEFLVFTGSAEEGFVVEYEFASHDNHQKIAGQRLSLDQVLEICKSYCADERSWYARYAWERVPIGEVDLRKAPQMNWGAINNDPETERYRKPPLQGRAP